MTTSATRICPPAPQLTRVDFNAVMRRNGAVLVHCAGFPKGIGNAETATYSALDCLKYAHANEGTCCAVAASTLTEATDCFEPYGRWANCTGPLGLIIAPASDRSVTGAAPYDFGSQLSPNGIRFVSEQWRHPSAPEFEAAIDGRLDDAHNEIVVANYRVLGLLVIACHGTEVDYGEVRYPLSTIVAMFPTLLLYRWERRIGVTSCTFDPSNGTLRSTKHGPQSGKLYADVRT